MDQKIEHDEKYQQFSIVFGDEEAELAYARPTDDVIDFTHTYVPQAERGKGIASKLIEHGMKYAETKGYSVVATCPTVKDYLERNPDYKRLLKEQE